MFYLIKSLLTHFIQTLIFNLDHKCNQRVWFSIPLFINWLIPSNSKVISDPRNPKLTFLKQMKKFAAITSKTLAYCGLGWKYESGRRRWATGESWWLLSYCFILKAILVHFQVEIFLSVHFAWTSLSLVLLALVKGIYFLEWYYLLLVDHINAWEYITPPVDHVLLLIGWIISVLPWQHEILMERTPLPSTSDLISQEAHKLKRAFVKSRGYENEVVTQWNLKLRWWWQKHSSIYMSSRESSRFRDLIKKEQTWIKFWKNTKSWLIVFY